MKMTIKQTVDKLRSINSFIEQIAAYDMKSAKDEHELDACSELIGLLKEYKEILLNTEITL